MLINGSMRGSRWNKLVKLDWNSTQYERRHAKTCFLAHLSRRLKGELIVYRSIRRPLVRPLVRPSVSASVNIFKLEYLRNQWANHNQILSEASLGWGIDCIRFWTR